MKINKHISRHSMVEVYEVRSLLRTCVFKWVKCVIG